MFIKPMCYGATMAGYTASFAYISELIHTGGGNVVFENKQHLCKKKPLLLRLEAH